MEIKESPILSSAGTAKSIWQSYHIFHNRLQLNTIIGKKIIPFNDMVTVELRSSNISLLSKELRNFRKFILTFKLDLVDFNEHLGVERKNGWVKKFLFTPRDPAAFKVSLEQAAEKYKRKSSG